MVKRVNYNKDVGVNTRSVKTISKTSKKIERFEIGTQTSQKFACQSLNEPVVQSGGRPQKNSWIHDWSEHIEHHTTRNVNVNNSTCTAILINLSYGISVGNSD